MRQWRSVARAGTVTPMVVEPQSLDSLSAEQLRELTARLMVQVRHQSALLEKLTHENALLKRMKFAAQSERFNPEQKSLLEDEIEADLAAVASEIDALTQTQAPATPDKKQAKRLPLPAHLPRREVRHEPASTTCACGCQMKRVGEDVAEAGLHARRLQRRAPYPRQVGLRPVREHHSGAG